MLMMSCTRKVLVIDCIGWNILTKLFHVQNICLRHLLRLNWFLDCRHNVTIQMFSGIVNKVIFHTLWRSQLILRLVIDIEERLKQTCFSRGNMYMVCAWFDLLGDMTIYVSIAQLAKHAFIISEIRLFQWCVINVVICVTVSFHFKC